MGADLPSGTNQHSFIQFAFVSHTNKSTVSFSFLFCMSKH